MKSLVQFLTNLLDVFFRLSKKHGMVRGISFWAGFHSSVHTLGTLRAFCEAGQPSGRPWEAEDIGEPSWRAGEPFERLGESSGGLESLLGDQESPLRAL